MQFRNPFFIENMMQDQPYCSLLLVAPFCDGACRGCQNLVLNDADVIDISVDNLVAQYKKNPFVDGITIAGLEICLSGDKFIAELMEFIAKAKVPRVTIYSRFAPTSAKLRPILTAIEQIPGVQELYCKTGEYIGEGIAKIVNLKHTADSKSWQISLASSNQDFLIIKSKIWQSAVA